MNRRPDFRPPLPTSGRICFIILICVSVCLGPCIFAQTACDFLSVEAPCNFKFPADHGSHPGFRTEWWYYTGNLESNSRQRYGYQLTFFRIQTSPACRSGEWPDRPSAWRTHQIYFGHAALSDVAARRHHQSQEAARNALGMSGVSQKRGGTVIFLKNWQAVIQTRQHLLSAQTPDFDIELQLTPLKPPVSHGRNGYSRKGSSPQRASCYYSFTRLATEGQIRIGDEKVQVQGLSWMDHEYSTAPLEPGIVGWDWFSLQLTDQTELMMYLLRKPDGSYHPASSGTIVNHGGSVQSLRNDQFSIRVLDTWRSPATRARYPSRWDISIPAIGLNLELWPTLADQEMQTQETTGVTYWEGSVRATGTKQKHPVEAKGYVEMTGYDKKFDAPM
jgi:predicted secreted hydrolase